MVAMTDLLGLVSILVLTGLAGWVLMTVAACAIARFVGDRETRPAVRRARAEWMAAMPLTGLVLAVLVVLLPAVLKSVGFIADHCLAHGLHHPHICFTHLPAFMPGLPLAILLIGALAAGATVVGKWALHQVRDRRLAHRIDRLSTSRWPLISVDLPGAQAFLLGPGRPRIVLSKTLFHILSPAERRAVVRHEIAHARAGDPRRKRWLEFLLAFHPPFFLDSIRAQWQQAVEEHADAAVAEQGGGLDLAQALVKAVRHQGPGVARPSTAMTVTAANLARRVRRLTGERAEHRGSVLLEIWLWSLPLMAAGWAATHHHALEHLLEIVLRRVTGG